MYCDRKYCRESHAAVRSSWGRFLRGPVLKIFHGQHALFLPSKLLAMGDFNHHSCRVAKNKSLLWEKTASSKKTILCGFQSGSYLVVWYLQGGKNLNLNLKKKEIKKTLHLIWQPCSHLSEWSFTLDMIEWSFTLDMMFASWYDVHLYMLMNAGKV